MSEKKEIENQEMRKQALKLIEEWMDELEAEDNEKITVGIEYTNIIGKDHFKKFEDCSS